MKRACATCPFAACGKWKARPRPVSSNPSKQRPDPALVRSAFALPAEQRAAIQKALDEILGAEVQLRFEIAPELIAGIELAGNGQKVGWSISDYLASLQERVAEFLKGESPARSGEPVNMNPEGLEKTFNTVFAAISQARKSFEPRPRPREMGVITSIATGVAKVSGLPGVGFEELVTFPGDILGIAFNVDEDELGVVLLGDYVRLRAGDQVERTGRVMDVAVGDGVLGRVIDPLGRPLDGGEPLAARGRLPIERPAVAIMDRAPVTEPLQTGIKVIDALIPIGRGQRELILGDRQTGKTAIALGAILNQRGQNVVCVYCAIGQRASAVAKAVAVLRESGAMDHTVVVVTEGDDPPGLAYIAPYAATSIAERFMEAGRDVLIVYDDLTQHAQAYRELSLLLRRPPGREAFPGDIFYVHSRLLERATRLRAELGGGSLTALPIVETEAQNISAYIPTNLISITDGQIYLSPSLFELGVLPAVDVGKSVSRVGGKAQRAAYRAVAGDLKLAYAQFEELETFARFGARLDDDTRKIIEHGRRIRACLQQAEFAPIAVPGQIAVLMALTTGLFNSTPIERMADAERAVIAAAERIPAEVRARFDTAEKLTEQDRAMILQIAGETLKPFRSGPETKANARIISTTETEARPGAVNERGPEGPAEIKPKPRRAEAASERAIRRSAGGGPALGARRSRLSSFWLARAAGSSCRVAGPPLMR